MAADSEGTESGESPRTGRGAPDAAPSKPRTGQDDTLPDLQKYSDKQAAREVKADSAKLKDGEQVANLFKATAPKSSAETLANDVRDRSFVADTKIEADRVRGETVHLGPVVHNQTTTNIYHGVTPPAGAASGRETVTPDNLPWPECAFAACAESIEDLCFLVAAAVLDGEPLAAVRNAAEALCRTISDDIPPAKDGAARPAQVRSITKLYDAFRISFVRELDADGLPAQRLRFKDRAEAVSVFVHAWTQIAGVPNWHVRLRNWLAELGFDKRQNIRELAGKAVALLWYEGVEYAETDCIEKWFSASSTLPLDALDACYVCAAEASAKLRENIAKKLWTWGNISTGVDGVFALCHLATRRYRLVDLDACLKGLEALLEHNNLLGLLHAQDAYQRLFASAALNPECCAKVARSLMNVMERAEEKHDNLLRLQVIALGRSLIEALPAKRGDPPVFDQVLAAVPDPSEFCQFVNTISRGSRMQGKIIHALRAAFVRGATSEREIWQDNPNLRFFQRLYTVGSEDDRERFNFHWSDWVAEAEQKSAAGGANARKLGESLFQGAE